MKALSCDFVQYSSEHKEKKSCPRVRYCNVLSLPKHPIEQADRLNNLVVSTGVKTNVQSVIHYVDYLKDAKRVECDGDNVRVMD